MNGNIRQRGFTLLEALIALVVLAIGLVAVAKFQGGILQSSSQSKARTEALNLAQQKIEELRHFTTNDGNAGDPDDYAGGDRTAGSHSDGACAGCDGSNADFDLAWVVTDFTNPAYKQVDVTVTWDDQEGEQSVSLTSYIASLDPQESGDIYDEMGTYLLPGSTTTSTTTTTTAPTTTTTTATEATTTTTMAPESTTSSTETVTSTTSTTTTPTTTTTSASTFFLTISGDFTLYGNVNKSFTVTASGNYTASCTNSPDSYVCDIGPVPGGDSWTGSVSVNVPNGIVYCSQNPPYPTPYSGLNEGDNQIQDYNIGKNENQCP